MPVYLNDDVIGSIGSRTAQNTGWYLYKQIQIGFIYHADI